MSAQNQNQNQLRISNLESVVPEAWIRKGTDGKIKIRIQPRGFKSIKFPTRAHLMLKGCWHLEGFWALAGAGKLKKATAGGTKRLQEGHLKGRDSFLGEILILESELFCLRANFQHFCWWYDSNFFEKR